MSCKDGSQLRTRETKYWNKAVGMKSANSFSWKLIASKTSTGPLNMALNDLMPLETGSPLWRFHALLVGHKARGIQRKEQRQLKWNGPRTAAKKLPGTTRKKACSALVAQRTQCTGKFNCFASVDFKLVKIFWVSKLWQINLWRGRNEKKVDKGILVCSTCFLVFYFRETTQSPQKFMSVWPLATKIIETKPNFCYRHLSPLLCAQAVRNHSAVFWKFSRKRKQALVELFESFAISSAKFQPKPAFSFKYHKNERKEATHEVLFPSLVSLFSPEVQTKPETLCVAGKRVENVSYILPNFLPFHTWLPGGHTLFVPHAYHCYLSAPTQTPHSTSRPPQPVDVRGKVMAYKLPTNWACHCEIVLRRKSNARRCSRVAVQQIPEGRLNLRWRTDV